MPIKNTIQIGDPILRKHIHAVRKVDDVEVQQCIQDLVASMRQNNLVGMAAPQIGKNLRMFVTEIRATTYRKYISEKDGLRVFINPIIIEKARQKTDGYEGCGSVASSLLFGPVKRSRIVIVGAQDLNGKYFELKAEGLLARVIQHEFDHLEGILFIDRVTNMRKLLDRESYVNSQKK